MLTVRTLHKKVREIDIATKDELRQARIFQLGTRGRRIGFGVRWHLADAELLSSCGLLLGFATVLGSGGTSRTVQDRMQKRPC